MKQDIENRKEDTVIVVNKGMMDMMMVVKQFRMRQVRRGDVNEQDSIQFEIRNR